jgi:hypothetical protein
LDVKLGTDCWDYHILEQCAKDIKGVEGLVCEVGTREGGSLQIIINALLDNSDTGRHVISVDPYGNIPYYGENGITRFDYTNDMKKKGVKEPVCHIREQGLQPRNPHLNGRTVLQ